jgi:hypothetical protein
VADSTPVSTTSVNSGDNYTFPDTPYVTGYIRTSTSDWYRDPACLDSQKMNSSVTVTASVSYYAKYTLPTEAPSYIYVAAIGITGANNGANGDLFIYTSGRSRFYGSEDTTPWGTRMALADYCTTGVNFPASGYSDNSGIWRIPFYPSAKDTQFYVGNGTNGGWTNTYALTAGAYYRLDLSASATGDSELGAAAKVVYDINRKRLAVTASGSILVKSICGISAADRTDLLAEYDALTSSQKASVNSATDYTYNWPDTSTNVNVLYSAIIAELRLLAAASGSSGVYLRPAATGPSLTLIIVASSGTLTLLFIGALFLYSRKKKRRPIPLR